MTTLPTMHRLAHVDARYDGGRWPWADRNEAEIARHWAEVTAKNTTLFNGRVLVATERQIVGDTLKVRYVGADYASFLTFRDQGFPDPGTGNCFGMAALRSIDGAYVLGVMGAHTSNAGRIYFPAGTPEPVDVLDDGRVDLLATVLRELSEETGLDPAEVEVGKGWTAMVEGGRTALMREVQSALTGEALHAQITAFLASEALPEFAGLRLIRTPDDIDPVAVPSFVQIYLRHALFRHGEPSDAS